MLRDIRETFVYILSQIENPIPDDSLGHQGVRFLCPLHPDTDPSARVYITNDYERIMAGCFGCEAPYTEFARHWGIRPSDMCPHREEAERDPIVATYEYRDENGNVRYEVCRRVSKKFPQRRAMHDGSWAWSLKAGKYRKGHGGDWYLVKRGQDPQPGDVSLPKVDKLLYNLPAIKNMDLSKTVLIVEGEKDADRIMLEAGESGHVATTSSAGAGKWTEQDANTLRGVHCVSVPDWDRPDPQTRMRPGSKHAQMVANSLLGKARSIRVLELSDLEEGEDISDWFDKGHAFNELLDLAAATTPWIDSMQLEGAEVVRIDEEEQADWLLNNLGLFIVGQEADERIRLFSLLRRRNYLANPREIETMKMDRLLMYVGQECFDKVTIDQLEANRDKRHFSEIRQFIMLSGPTNQLTPDNFFGLGTWKLKNEDGPDSIVLCNGSHLSVLNSQPLEKILIPAYRGRFFNFHGPSRDWFDHDMLATNLTQPSSWKQAVISEIHELFGQFVFQNPTDTELVIGLLLATWLQSVWKFRPQVSLIGKTNAGKTSFLRLSREFYGEQICTLSDRPTAAYIRQKNGSNNLIFQLDEMDKAEDRHRYEVFNLIRTSTRSSEIGRGSAGGKAISTKMAHIFWVAGIDSGLIDAADINRWAQIEFPVPEDGHQGNINESTPVRNWNLGQKALACMLSCWTEVERILTLLVEHRPEGSDRRIAEVHALPAACYGVVVGMPEEEIKLLHASFLGAWDSEHKAGMKGGDERQLMEFILQSLRRIGSNEYPISSLINMVLGNWEGIQPIMGYDQKDSPDHAEQALGAVGIRAIPSDTLGEPGSVFFHCKTLMQHVFNRSEKWKGKTISTILGRIPGVEKQTRCRVLSGKQTKTGLMFTEEMLFLPE